MRGLFLAALAGVASAALSPISRKGAYLFDSSGARFYLKGVAYSANYGSGETPVDPGSISRLDPLANAAGCTRDIPFFKQLGINVIRVYQVNATLSHDACMSALSSAGIYVLLDLASPAPNAAINTASPSWNTGLFTSFASTIAAFGSYDNVLGFNVGNEVINSLQDDQAAPYIKAAVRDTKAYLTAHGYTQLVGYAGTDSPNSRVALPDYLACETTEGKDQLDYWALNIYEWCGTSSFEQSGYKARTDELANLGVPSFFSEYGCTSVTPRTFDDVPVLYSSDMTNVWSGGLVYEYQMESNAFGLVTISADGKTVTPNTDFDNLKSRYSSASPPSLSKDSYSPSGTAPSCPASDAATWPASTSIPPSPNADVCSCISSSLSCSSTYDSTTDLGVVGKALGTVCGTPGASGVCSDISGNGTTGSYGSLEMCDPLTQLNAVLDKYYASQNNAASACDFGGIAKVTGSGKGGANALQGCLDKGFKGGVGVPVPSALPAGLSVKPAVAGSTETGTGKTGAGGGKNGAESVRVGLLGVFGAVTCGMLMML